jgi:hypothetical protein
MARPSALALETDMDAEDRPVVGVGGGAAVDVSAGTVARTFLLDSVSWGAVFAGVVVALVTQLVLSLFGIAVGAGTLDPGTADNPSAQALSTGAAVWWILSGVLSTAAGAYVASRLAGKPLRSTGAWHGLTTWAVTTLITFWLVTSAVGNVVGGALRMVTDAAGGAASVVGQVAQTGATAIGGDTSAIEQSVGDALPGEPQGRQAVMAALQAAVSGGDPAQLALAREEAAQAIARARGVPIDQARVQVARLESQVAQQRAQVGQQATAAAEATTRAVSQGALWSAISLVLGAIVAALAGWAGTVSPEGPIRLRRLEQHPA